MKLSIWFSGFGFLSWLDTKEYYKGEWTYVHSAHGDDGERYDIVRNEDGTEYRYTLINGWRR